MSRLLIATRNSGKLREYQAVLGDLGLELRTLVDEGIDVEVPETGTTFRENATLKARRYAELSGLPTLADDSGLEVDALGGEPGVYSARFGGEGLTDAGRVDYLLRRLAGVPEAQRTARFRCAIAIALPGGEIQVVEGTLPGRIATVLTGEHGFGYDPVFFLPERGRTVAELLPEEKNRISHRAQAVRAARPILAELKRRGVFGR